MKTPSQKKYHKSILITAAIIGCIFSLSACSGSGKTSDSSLAADDNKKTSFSFTTFENGLTNQWDVYFNEDTISAIYKNKNRVPDDQISMYSDMVYDELDDLNNNRHEQNFSNDNDIDIHIDMSSLEESLGKLSEELSKHKIHVEFDQEQFDLDMQNLEKELENLKDIDININFDPETLKENMKELKRNLKHLKINKNDFRFDGKEFNKCMKELAENMRNVQFTMNDNLRKNMELLHKNMNNFNFKLNNIKLNLNNIKFKLNKFDSFLKELKTEMVKDGLIKNADDDVEIHFSKDSLEVNDMAIPNELFEKYKCLYEKYFGTEIEEDADFNIHE